MHGADVPVGAGVPDGPQVSEYGTFGASGTPPPTARQIRILVQQAYMIT